MKVRQLHKTIKLSQLQFDMANAKILAHITYTLLLDHKMAHYLKIFAFQDFFCLTSFHMKASSVNVIQF